MTQACAGWHSNFSQALIVCRYLKNSYWRYTAKSNFVLCKVFKPCYLMIFCTYIRWNVKKYERKFRGSIQISAGCCIRYWAMQLPCLLVWYLSCWHFSGTSSCFNLEMSVMWNKWKQSTLTYLIIYSIFKATMKRKVFLNFCIPKMQSA